jgi:hypothetical protein
LLIGICCIALASFRCQITRAREAELQRYAAKPAKGRNDLQMESGILLRYQ